MVDYPEKLSAIIFTQGCNFACPYCHNPELLDFNVKGDFDQNNILEFLQKRKGKLDAVVITGGEPTMQYGLIEFIKEIKEMNYLVKLDTNGTNTKMLDKIMKEDIVDYFAMDIKAPLEKYNLFSKNINTENIKQSIKLIKDSGKKYEFRTTIVKSLLSFDDFKKISKLLKGSDLYILQKFLPTKILNESYIKEVTYSDKEFLEIKEMMLKNISTCYVR